MKEVWAALAPFLEIGVLIVLPCLTASYSCTEGEQRAHTPHLLRWLWFSRTSSMDDGSLGNNFRTGWKKLLFNARWTLVVKKFDGNNEASTVCRV